MASRNRITPPSLVSKTARSPRSVVPPAASVPSTVKVGASVRVPVAIVAVSLSPSTTTRYETSVLWGRPTSVALWLVPTAVGIVARSRAPSMPNST